MYTLYRIAYRADRKILPPSVNRNVTELENTALYYFTWFHPYKPYSIGNAFQVIFNRLTDCGFPRGLGNSQSAIPSPVKVRTRETRGKKASSKKQRPRASSSKDPATKLRKGSNKSQSCESSAKHPRNTRGKSIREGLEHSENKLCCLVASYADVLLASHTLLLNEHGDILSPLIISWF